MSPSQPNSPPADRAFPKGAITFFYYENLPAAHEFYRHVVGLKTAADFGWCAMMELRPHTYLGLVNGSAGSQRPLAGPNKAVVLSLETDDLEACLERMQSIGAATAATRLVPGCEGRTIEFKIVDPGGYTVEFFRWVQPLP